MWGRGELKDFYYWRCRELFSKGTTEPELPKYMFVLVRDSKYATKKSLRYVRADLDITIIKRKLLNKQSLSLNGASLGGAGVLQVESESSTL